MCLVILEILNDFQRSQMLNWCTFLYLILRFLHREGDTRLFFRQLAKSTFNIKKIGWKVTTLSSQSCRPSLIPLTIATKKAWSDAVDLVFTKIQLSHKMLQHRERLWRSFSFALCKSVYPFYWLKPNFLWREYTVANRLNDTAWPEIKSFSLCSQV